MACQIVIDDARCFGRWRMCSSDRNRNRCTPLLSRYQVPAEIWIVLVPGYSKVMGMVNVPSAAMRPPSSTWVPSGSLIQAFTQLPAEKPVVTGDRNALSRKRRSLAPNR